MNLIVDFNLLALAVIAVLVYVVIRCIRGDSDD